MGLITDFLHLNVAGVSLESLAVAGLLLFGAVWVYNKVASHTEVKK